MKINLNDEKVMRIVGIVTTVAGIGISIAESVLAEKTMDNKISKKVSEELAKQKRTHYSHRR